MYAVHNESRAGMREEGAFESQGALFALVVVLQLGTYYGSFRLNHCIIKSEQVTSSADP